MTLMTYVGFVVKRCVINVLHETLFVNPFTSAGSVIGLSDRTMPDVSKATIKHALLI